MKFYAHFFVLALLCVPFACHADTAVEVVFASSGVSLKQEMILSEETNSFVCEGDQVQLTVDLIEQTEESLTYNAHVYLKAANGELVLCSNPVLSAKWEETARFLAAQELNGEEECIALTLKATKI